jgi:hypothetical protein
MVVSAKERKDATVQATMKPTVNNYRIKRACRPTVQRRTPMLHLSSWLIVALSRGRP